MPFGCPKTCPEYADGICVCPAGCTGNGDFKYWADSCHVNVRVHAGLSWASLLLSSFVLLVSMLAMYENGMSELVRVFNAVRRSLSRCCRSYCRRAPSEDGQVSVDSCKNEETDEDSEDTFRRSGTGTISSYPIRGTHVARALQKHIAAQHVLSLWLTMCIGLFSVCIIIAEALSLYAGVYRWQEPSLKRGLLDGSYTLAACTLVLSGHIVSYKWYGALPSIRRYGKLFGISTILVHHPSAFKAVTLFSGVSSVALVFTFLFLLPILRPEMQNTWDTATLGTLAVSAIVWGSNIAFLSSLLLRIYKRAKMAILRRSIIDTNPSGHVPYNMRFGKAGRVALHLATRSNEWDAVIYREFRTMRSTIYGTLLMASVGTVIIATLLVGSIFIVEMQENLYITLTLVTICGELGALGLMYVAVFRTNPRFENWWPSSCIFSLCAAREEEAAVDDADLEDSDVQPEFVSHAV